MEELGEAMGITKQGVLDSFGKVKPIQNYSNILKYY